MKTLDVAMGELGVEQIALMMINCEVCCIHNHLHPFIHNHLHTQSLAYTIIHNHSHTQSLAYTITCTLAGTLVVL
jgi:hypothetical protein